MSARGRRPARSAGGTAALIVTHNSTPDIGVLLDSLAATGLGLVTLVVDNASTDATVSTVRSRPGVTCVETGENAGYAGAINVGLRHLPADLDVLLLNADLELDRTAVIELQQALDGDAGIGIAVPNILNADGSLFHSLRREPTLLRMLGDALLGGRLASRPGALSETIWAASAYARSGRADWATGAAMLISAECRAAVGDWDERFFLYSEETDYARRARDLGLALQYVPSARVTHHGGGSGSSAGLAALLALNRVRYVQKWRSPGYAALFRRVALLHEALRSRRPEHRAGAEALRRGGLTLPGVGAFGLAS